MTRARNRLILSATWLTVILIALTVLVGGLIYRLDQRRDQLDDLRQEIERKQRALEPFLTTVADEASPAEDALVEWAELIDSESRRIGGLATAAKASGVTLVSLQSGREERSEDGLITSCDHELIGVGDYRQVAAFLDGIYAAPGMAGINRLELERDEAAPEQVRASLRVTWYAPGPGEAVE